jgi:hypothetical protein
VDGYRFRIDELKFPHQHWRLLECAQAFASRKQQEKWLGPPVDFDTLDETWNFLGDHAVFGRDCHELIGVSLRDAPEAVAMNRLTMALNSITAALGRNATPAECFAHPGWKEVMEAARKAERLLERGDY